MAKIKVQFIDVSLDKGDKRFILVATNKKGKKIAFDVDGIK